VTQQSNELADELGTRAPAPDGPKEEYSPPTLRTLGTVRDLTQTQPAGPNFDGGAGANIYAS
jgi:hypothetical protein